ncbi:mechanosensitive ion channel family protein [Algoriphagus sp.]|uniref:mechanosensitive ion channel family protein n=1 Tax=Algoriphagus sp. TaxID=1872435 RepID=UPI00391CE56B
MIKRLFLSPLLLLLFIHLAYPQLITDKIELVELEEGINLTSPYHTTLTFFYNLERGHFFPDRAAKTFDLKSVKGDAEDLTVKLQQIFEGKGIVIRTSEVPNDPDFADSTLNSEQKFYFDRIKLPAIFLEKKGNQWKFSAFSVSQIENLHRETYPYGTDRLLNILPKIGTREYLGLQLWQLVGITFLIFLTFLAHLVFTFLVDKGLIYGLDRLGYGYIGENYLLPVAKITSIYLIVLLLSFLIRILQLPVEIYAWIIPVFDTLKPFLITVIFYKIVDVVAAYFASLAAKTESTLDDQLVPLIRKTLKGLVILVGTLFVLRDGLNFDIIPFLTGISIGGVAIALAAQDTIKNFFGSIMIFIDKPFQVGDWVTSGEIDGTVEEVGFRSTRIRTFRNSVMYVPNGKIADAVVDNHGLRQYRRFFTTLTITYDTPPELIEAFVKGLHEIVLAHPNTRKDYFNIFFNNLSAYSQDVMFYIFFEVPTWPEELKSRHEILIQIVKLANVLGVRFAFPTQTLHMDSFPEKTGLTPSYPGEQEYTARLGNFVRSELGQKNS